MRSQLENLVSFPLQKFSYVTTPTVCGKFLWSHLAGPSLVAVFDYAHTNFQEPRTEYNTLRIYDGSQVLDQILLGNLLDQIRSDDATLRTHAVPDGMRKVLILEKKPFIAIRYSLPDTQTRRIQMNFAYGSDFDRALGFLHRAGLTVHHKEIELKPLAPEVNLGHVGSLSQQPSQFSQDAQLSSSFQYHNNPTYQAPHLGPQISGPFPENRQWTYHSQDKEPLIGPSLVESVSAQQLQPLRGIRQQSFFPSHSTQSSQSQYPSFMPDGHHYHSQGSRSIQTATTTDLDPIRRSLFSRSEEDKDRPITAPAIPSNTDTLQPLRQQIPFQNQISETTTSTSNVSKNGSKAANKKQVQPRKGKSRSEQGNAAAVPPEPTAKKRKTGTNSKRLSPAEGPSQSWVSPGAIAMLPSPANATLSVSGSNTGAAPVTDTARPPPSKRTKTVPQPQNFNTQISTIEPVSKPQESVSLKKPLEVSPRMTRASSKQRLAAEEDQYFSTQSSISIIDMTASQDLPYLAELGSTACKAPPSNIGVSTLAAEKIINAREPQLNSTANSSANLAPSAACSPKKDIELLTATQASKSESKPAPLTTAKRKRTSAPKKPKPKYVSSGIQTSPRGERAPAAEPTTEAPHHTLSPTVAAIDTAPPSTLPLVPPPLALDVPFDWQATVEAFVLRHRARILAPPPPCIHAPSVVNVAAAAGALLDNAAVVPSTPSAAPQASNNDAVEHELEFLRSSADLEPLVVACLRAPDFEALCAQVESVWQRVAPESGHAEMEV